MERLIARITRVGRTPQASLQGEASVRAPLRPRNSSISTRPFFFLFFPVGLRTIIGTGQHLHINPAAAVASLFTQLRRINLLKKRVGFCRGVGPFLVRPAQVLARFPVSRDG